MSLLSKDQILQADDLQTETVSVPEWDGDVLVSEMSADTRDQLEQHMAEQAEKDRKNRRIRAMLCAFCIVDENKERMFTIKEMEQLGKKNGNVMDRLFDAANRLNKVFSKPREDTEKNSETTPDVTGDGS